MTSRLLTGLLLILVVASACGPYRMMRPDEITIPNYEPRPVTIPPTCAPLIASMW